MPVVDFVSHIALVSPLQKFATNHKKISLFPHKSQLTCKIFRASSQVEVGDRGRTAKRRKSRKRFNNHVTMWLSRTWKETTLVEMTVKIKFDRTNHSKYINVHSANLFTLT
jgi:hypothetical protein